MNIAKYAGWLFFLLMALAGSSWYLASTAPLMKLDDQTLAKLPDSIVTGLVVKQFNQKGTLINVLDAPQMHHIPEQDTHIFDYPHIILTQEDGSTWNIRSQLATAVHKGEKIVFNKQVVIDQINANHNSSKLQTEELTYSAINKIAHSDKAVTFTQAGSIVKAVGMNAYLTDKRIVLLQKAEAVYQPKLSEVKNPS